jgi:signal transduction histidine kinase
VAVARDITRRKRVDLAKSETISAVSHELRSPLTSVKGFTATLLSKWDRLDDETKKHLLFTIDTDADRVTRLIGELLDVSRLEAGRLHLQRQMVCIVDVAREVVERVGHLSSKHMIGMDFPDAFPEVYADPDKIQQVLTNLVENAVKYTAGGRVDVTGSYADGTVQVAVSDEGEGIPAEHRHQVFGKFFRRIGGSPTGTGLGLYITKGLIEAHGGHIWVDEAPGGGAVFAFTLPVATPRQP